MVGCSVYWSMHKRAGTIGRPRAEVVLTAEEREALERYAKGRTVSQGLALRARIVLRCAQGLSNDQVAEELGIWPQTVCRWRRRFVHERFDASRCCRWCLASPSA